MDKDENKIKCSAFQIYRWIFKEKIPSEFNTLSYHPTCIRFRLFLQGFNGSFQTEQPQTNGLPSVAWCARELNLSAN